MQWFDRKSVPVPAILKGQQADASRMQLLKFFELSIDRREQTRYARSGLMLEHDEGLKSSLSHLFRGRCSFCESAAETRPYHFRPVSEAFPLGREQEPHLYYAWLETAWENLYAICSSCMPDEPRFFPVSGARCPIPGFVPIQRFVEDGEGSWWLEINESPLLVDPCATKDFIKIFGVRWDGEIVGLSKRGTQSIDHFHLNAPDLREARARRYSGYWDRLMNGAELRALDNQADLFDFQGLEFGGTWQLLLRRVAKEVARQLNLQTPSTPTRLRKFFDDVLGTETNIARAKLAVERLKREDADRLHEVIQQAVPKKAAKRSTGTRITSVSLTNFKAIESLEIRLPEASEADKSNDEKPVPSLLILGENAAGKSSVLEAIALTLCDDRVRQKIRARASQPWELVPHYLGGTEPDRRRAEVMIEQADGGQCHLRIAANDFDVISNPFWERVPVFAYGAFRKFDAGHRSKAITRHVDSLFYGVDLTDPESWLLGLPDERFNMVIRALREILSIEGEFDVVERDFARQECFVVTAIPGGDARVRTPLSAVSSGFRSVLAMACDVMDGLMTKTVYPDFGTLATSRGVVLIDEVEAHLHPRWKMQIMSGLRRALPKMTFIATTHDPLCLRGMNDGEVTVLHRVSSKDSALRTALPMVVEARVDLPNVSDLRVEQLLTSDFFQLNSTDAPLMDRKLASVAEWLARDPSTLEPDDRAALETFQRDLEDALPIGATEAHRLVQEAVAEYLKERRQASERRIGELREQAKLRIIQALRGGNRA